MTNTERLISEHATCQKHGVNCRFAVGKYTGNGPTVVPALRRRGYTVTKLRNAYYELTKA